MLHGIWTYDLCIVSTTDWAAGGKKLKASKSTSELYALIQNADTHLVFSTPLESGRCRHHSTSDFVTKEKVQDLHVSLQAAPVTRHFSLSRSSQIFTPPYDSQVLTQSQSHDTSSGYKVVAGTTN